MKRIMVGVDGSPAAEHALVWACRLARPSGAEVVVATTFSPSESEVSPTRYIELETAAARRLDQEWSAPAQVEGVEFRPALYEGEPDVLLERADAEDSDLLVVGTRGRGGFAGLDVGSVAHHFVHHATRPLAIVPPSTELVPLERVVIGVDGSEGSAEALRWCTLALAPVAPSFIAVHAVSPPEWEDDPRRIPGLAGEKLRAWVAPLTAAGLEVIPLVEQDVHPVAALAAVTRARHAGLVVVGTRGLGGFTGLRLGRVPLQLLHQTAVPVVMVPPHWN